MFNYAFLHSVLSALARIDHFQTYNIILTGRAIRAFGLNKRDKMLYAKAKNQAWGPRLRQYKEGKDEGVISHPLKFIQYGPLLPYSYSRA